MQENKVFFLSLLLTCCVTTVWAATATVTNNGNMTVRVQYKTPDGQYEDLGYVKPGETVDVPGGVEKVRIVRDPGEGVEPFTWPWYGGSRDFFFPFMLFMMWPFMILMWLRHMMQTRYYIEGELVEAPRLLVFQAGTFNSKNARGVTFVMSGKM